jgi:hypothetical protein
MVIASRKRRGQQSLIERGSIMLSSTARLLPAAVIAATALLASAAPASAAGPTADVSVRGSYWGDLLTPGTQATFWVNIANAHNAGSAAEQVRVTGELPPGLRLVSAGSGSDKDRFDCSASSAERLDCVLRGELVPASVQEGVASFGVTVAVTDDAKAGQSDVELAISTATPETVTDNNTDRLHLPVVTEYGTVTGRVWNDLNHNGLQDQGEPGLPGHTLSLWASGMGSKAVKTITGANGEYQFTRVPASEYSLRLDKSSEWKLTRDNVPGNEDTDSDFDTAWDAGIEAFHLNFDVAANAAVDIDAGLIAR